MTNPTPHGQEPEALRLAHIFDNPLPPEWPDMVAAAAELRRQHARIAELEAVGAGGVQALSAAPAGFVPVAAFNRLHAHAESLAARLLAASPTPPAEQQATKETSGGFHVWRDISTAPKDGSRFVATGHNYGLYSEGRHICVAQWFRGCWMETSDWNEASELQHLTHWLPLPSPPDNAAELNDLDVSVSPQQAAPKAAPGEQNTVPAEWLEQAYREGWAACRDAETIGEEAEDWAFGNSTANSRMIDAQQAAPQQEAQEPSHRETVDVVGVRSNGEHVNLGKIAMPPRMKAREIAIEQFGRFKDDDGSDAEMCFGALEYFLEWLIQQGWSKAPQPAPAPLSDDAKDAARYRWLRATTNFATNSQGERIDVRNQPEKWDAAIDAALAAQEGKA